jgi:hypothetical protein
MSPAAQNDLATPTQENQNHEDPPILRAANATKTPQAQKPPLAASRPSSKAILFFMTLHFLLAFCELVLIAPLIKLLEQSLCISHYGRHDPSVSDPEDGRVPEWMCKIPEIQVPLATIRGWKAMLDTIPGG